MIPILKEMWEDTRLFFKQLIFSTLTEENREKIVKRLQDEIKDIKVLEDQELSKIKNELYEELSDYHTEEEIEDIYKIITSEKRRR